MPHRYIVTYTSGITESIKNMPDTSGPWVIFFLIKKKDKFLLEFEEYKRVPLSTIESIETVRSD
jgi:hypothetical protein